MERRKNKESSFSIAIVVAIVLIASALLILRPVPEHLVARSDDAQVRVEGVSRSSSTIQIERLDGVETSIDELVSPLYQVSVGDQGVLHEAQVTFSFLEFARDTHVIQDVVIYRFNRQTLAWESVPTLFDLAQGTLMTSMTISASEIFGLGIRER